jgi:acyl dehydratase
VTAIADAYSCDHPAVPTVLDGIDGVVAAVGDDLGRSAWIEVDQTRVDLFAEATGDHQWIHVDPAKAAAGPFGAPIAHGYLTLALSNLFLPQIVDVQGFSTGVNYGTGKVRFPAPVRVGSRIRGQAQLLEAVEIAGGVQTVMRVTIEIEDEPKPACVIEAISRYVV